MNKIKILASAMSEMDRITPRPLSHEDYAKVAISEITKLYNITTSEDQDMMCALISGITVNPANLEEIIKERKINGNMLREIGYVMEQYFRYRTEKIISRL